MLLFTRAFLLVGGDLGCVIHTGLLVT